MLRAALVLMLLFEANRGKLLQLLMPIYARLYNKLRAGASLSDDPKLYSSEAHPERPFLYLCEPLCFP